MKGSGLPKKMGANTTRFRNGVASAGFAILEEDHQMRPAILGDGNLIAADMTDKMLGIYLIIEMVIANY